MRRNRSLDVWLELEVDKVPDAEDTIGTMFVNLRLHALLSSLKVFSDGGHHGVAFRQHSLDVSNGRS
jgi:hypothetical protein